MNHNTITFTKRGQKILTVVSGIILLLLLLRTFTTPGDVPEDYTPAVYASAVALLPPIVAIVLALITKEAYNALILGILTGAALYSGGNLKLMLTTILYHPDGGMIYQLANVSHASILVFVATLGILVILMKKSGGSEAFGNWAHEHIKTKAGAALATMILGILIFVDDGFNCMTVGSVMRPLTDKFNINRAKLAYIIDSTAAPVCIIAPVSSWAAAVSYSLPEDMNVNGFLLFLKTIPYNMYALTALVMLLVIIVKDFDFGIMKKVIDEDKKAAKDADISFLDAGTATKSTLDTSDVKSGKVKDLAIPVVFLIVCCIIGMMYTGGFFDGTPVIDAFANADGAMSLVMGSSVTLFFSFFFYVCRGVISFEEFMKSLAEGWGSFVAPMIILIFAWTLSGITDLLGARVFIRDIVEASAGGVKIFLPVMIFVIAVMLAFSTGTSWGTFSILIPIVCNVFSPDAEMFVISIAACLSGAVCGDHCSPISDTTIMSSAGAGCNHITHVTTQLPYALTAAVISGIGYLIAGIIGYTTGSGAALLATPITLAIAVVVLGIIKKKTSVVV